VGAAFSRDGRDTGQEANPVSSDRSRLKAAPTERRHGNRVLTKKSVHCFPALTKDAKYGIPSASSGFSPKKLIFKYLEILNKICYQKFHIFGCFEEN